MHKIKIVPKGWGFERWIVNKEEYCGKELFILARRCTSLHMHKIKDETLYVAEGTLRIEYLEPSLWNHKQDLDVMSEWWKRQSFVLDSGVVSTCLTQGDAFHIPPYMIHQLKGQDGDVRLFEFSTQHFNEDSYRIIPGD